MKRIGNLYPLIKDKENINLAHKNAQKKKKNRKDIKRINKNKEYYLGKTQKILENKTYKSSKYHFKEIIDKGKKREIAILPYFPDRIIHWAVMNQLEPIFMSTFIFQSYAAIPEKGTHLAARKVQKDMRRNTHLKYGLKIDVKKFFPNIDKEILKDLLRRKIKDKDLLLLLDEIIDGYPKSGIPIGNYTSQYFGNFYLTYFDHWLKEDKKVKVMHRYMDDIIILGETKEELWNLLDEIRSYLWNNLKLTVKENYQVFPISDRGVNFVGYRIFPEKIILRNSTKRNMIRKSHKLMKKESLTDCDKSSIASYNGILKHVTGVKLKKDILAPLQERVKT